MPLIQYEILILTRLQRNSRDHQRPQNTSADASINAASLNDSSRESNTIAPAADMVLSGPLLDAYCRS